MNTAPTAAKPFGLATIKQAIALCWVETLDLVPVVWGPVGWTKSATVKSLCRDFGWPVFDVRLSDKEPADLGGIPFPTDREYDGRVRKVLAYLANALLPWADLYGEEFPCVLFLDEIDRTSVDVLNAALQILLDRGINGRTLSKGCRIVAAGNGATDTGTTELTSAAATRLVHFYVDTEGPNALDHWREWASSEDGNLDPALVGFSGFRPELFGCRKWDYVDLAQPNPRTWTWASEVVRVYDDVCTSAGFSVDVRDAIVFGLVGQAAGVEYLAYRRVLHACPPFEDVVKDPAACPIPPSGNPGILYALGAAFTSRLYDAAAAVEDPANPAAGEVNPKHTEAVAAYFARCVEADPSARESAAWWFTTASAKLASLRSTDAFGWVTG